MLREKTAFPHLESSEGLENAFKITKASNVNTFSTELKILLVFDILLPEQIDISHLGGICVQGLFFEKKKKKLAKNVVFCCYSLCKVRYKLYRHDETGVGKKAFFAEESF